VRRIVLVLAAVTALCTAVAVAYAQQSSPTVTTGGATAVKQHAATLHGTVRPNGAAATWFFQYGTTTAYGNHTANHTAPAGQGTQDVARSISGLLSGTTYHYRLVATNSSGTTRGADKTFTTTGPVQFVSLGASDNPITFGHTIRFVGQVSPPNNAGAVVTLQAKPYPYTGQFLQVGNSVVANPNGEFAFNVTALVNAQYRAVTQRGGVNVFSPSVLERVKLSVSSSVSDATPRKGRTVKFSGSVKPSHVGVVVRIQRQSSSGSYKTIKTTRTRAGSSTRATYSVHVRITRTARYRVKVSSGDGDHDTGYSKSRRIKVH
jgi:hypothetical protein